MIDFFRREKSPVPAPTPPKPAEQPTPLNPLEKQVAEAPPIVAQAKKATEDLKAEALHTMEIMEAARAVKGPFCLTLGEGENRAVLLVAPIEGNVYDAVSPPNENFPERKHRFTYTDYVALTANGPRRFGFKTDVESPLYKGSNKDRLIDSEKKELDKFRRFIDGRLESGNVTVKDANYKEGETEWSLYIPTLDKTNVSRRTRISKSEFAHSEEVDVITDPTITSKALDLSLKKVQNPLKAQIADARSQINATTAISTGLK